MGTSSDNNNGESTPGTIHITMECSETEKIFNALASLERSHVSSDTRSFRADTSETLQERQS